MLVRDKKKHKKNRIVRYVALGLALVITILAMMFNSGVTALRKVSGYVIVPVVTVFDQAFDGVGNFFASFGKRARLQSELTEAQKKLAQLETIQSVSDDVQAENDRLLALLGEKANYPNFQFEYASVIVRSTDDYSATYTLNKGSKDGVRANMVVLSVGGLAGKIIEVTDHSSVMLAVIDSRSSVPALAQSSRDAGVVTGVSNAGNTAGTCNMTGLPTNAMVRPGDTIITSGMGTVYPKGIVIGTVTQVSDAGSAQLTSTATLTPGVDFNHLENVLIVVGTEG